MIDVITFLYHVQCVTEMNLMVNNPHTKKLYLSRTQYSYLQIENVRCVCITIHLCFCESPKI